MIITTRVKQKIFNTPMLGLLPQTKDARDIKVGKLWFGGYTPKNKKVSIEPRKIHWQKFNTCGWASSAGMKEIDEKEIETQYNLSKRSLVIRGRIEGVISRDGFSNLRDNEKMVKDFGISETKYIDDEEGKNMSWDSYANSKLLTQQAVENAKLHRSKSFASVDDEEDMFRTLDEGRPFKIGISWFTGYNMGEGFKFPWILKPNGYNVGGHAMYANGYDLGYQGEKVVEIVNSFGASWGNNGRCFMRVADLVKEIQRYGAFTNYDLDVDILRWLQANQGKIVKTSDNPKVYLIQGDKKRWFPDPATLFVHGRTFSDIIEIPANIDVQIKEGEIIQFKDGGSINEYKNAVKFQPELKEIFAKYFN
jgi:hypothetical protein